MMNECINKMYPYNGMFSNIKTMIHAATWVAIKIMVSERKKTYAEDYIVFDSKYINCPKAN